MGSTRTTQSAKTVAERNRRRKAGLVLTGDTILVKAEAKAAGGIWDARLSGWLMPDEESMTAVATLMIERADEHTARRNASFGDHAQTPRRRTPRRTPRSAGECVGCGETEHAAHAVRCWECGAPL